MITILNLSIQRCLNNKGFLKLLDIYNKNAIDEDLNHFIISKGLLLQSQNSTGITLFKSGKNIIGFNFYNLK